MIQLSGRQCQGCIPLRSLFATVVAVMLLLASHTGLAQDGTCGEASKLSTKGLELSQKGKHSDAKTLIKRALAIGKTTLGPDHSNVATLLDNLATLYTAERRYADAEPLRNRALAIREKALGPDHPDVAASLNNLAVLYEEWGRYADAEPLHKRSLAIREKALGLDHPGVALSLHNLGVLYRKWGRYADAEPLLKRALAIREKALGPNHLDVALSLQDVAVLYSDQGRYADAEPLHKRALAVREDALGPDHLDVATELNHLGALYSTQGRYAEAEPLYKRALAIREKALGPDHLGVANCLNNLAVLYGEQGRYSDAEPLDKRALAIREKALGPDHPDVAVSLNNLATLYKHQGCYADAEPLYKRALAIKENALGPDHRRVAGSLKNLAELYRELARYSDAEPLYKRALTIEVKALGPEHPDIATSLNNLALLYGDQGRYAEAEPLLKRALTINEKAFGLDNPHLAANLNSLASLYRKQVRAADAERLDIRALAIREKALGPDHPDVAVSLNSLAVLYGDQGRYAEAEPLLKRALAIKENALGPDHPRVARSLDDLATLYRVQHRYAEAEPLYQRELAIDEKALGPDHLNVATSLNNLAVLYREQGRYAEAEPLYQRVLAIYEKALGPDHRDVATSLHNLAVYNQGVGRLKEAIEASRRSVAIWVKRIGSDANDHSQSDTGEQKSGRDSFLFLLSLLAAQPSDASGLAPAIVEEAFRMMQYAGSMETARAVAAMTDRFASGSDALAELVRQRQDLQGRWHALDGALVKAVSQSPEKGSAEGEASLRNEIADVDAKLAAADEQLHGTRAAEFASAKPVTIAEAQKLLTSDEALVVWTVGAYESFVVVVRKDRATFFRSSLTRKDISGVIASLRKSFDIRHPLLNELPPFDTAKAYSLYQQLLAPAESLLAGATSLIIVPDGALQRLPPSLLVTEAPTAPIVTPADYKSVGWLARRYALSVIPAVSSLTLLRNFAEAHHASKPFIGFGDPDFRGADAERVNKDVAQAKTILQNLGLFVRGGALNIEDLRQLSPLPETAKELQAEAELLGAPSSNVYLGKDATVTKVRSLDLADTRVVAFATHGLVAGQFNLSEPALALTPPSDPTEEDDGLLRASDVLRLKLNADLVVLSACNTASPDGTPGAESLSGLAKAFFYAGARSLLVSHWPVDSAATVKLTTSAFDALKKEPAIGRAEAFRRALLAMIDDAGKNPGDANDAHPLFWAPFVVVGEGGSGK